MPVIPPNCLRFIDHKKILRSDIGHNRPYGQANISSERTLRHGFVVRRGFLKWKVFSTTSYEMSSEFDFISRDLTGRRWAETDLTGLEWQFKNKQDAENFRNDLINNDVDKYKKVATTKS